MDKIKKLQIILDILIVFLIVILIVLYVFYSNNKSKEEKIDYTNYKSKKLNDSENVDLFTFSETTIISIKDFKTLITVRIKNNSNDKYFVKGITADVYDNNNKLLNTIYGDAKVIINSNEIIEYNFETSIDIYSNCKYLKYKPVFAKYGEEDE